MQPSTPAGTSNTPNLRHAAILTDAFGYDVILNGAGIDPTDVNAFVTGLTFAEFGTVDMNMNPISFNTDAAVPEPNGLALVMAAMGLGLVGRGRKTRGHCVEAGHRSRDLEAPAHHGRRFVR